MRSSSQMLDSMSSVSLDPRRLARCYVPRMKTTPEIRLENLLWLIKQAGSQAAFARRVRKDPRQVSQWKGRKGARSLSDATAREIETAMVLPRGWMDQPHESGSLSTAESESDPGAGQIERLEQEIGALTGVLAILLNRLGSQLPAEAALVALQIRRFLTKPGYDGEVVPQLLRAAEEAVPSSGPDALPKREASPK